MGIRARVLFCLFFAASRAKADCDADVDEYISGLTNLKLWSLEMFDSSTKFTTDGIMELSFVCQLANFDQCVAINGPSGTDGKPKFTGQYCHFSMGLEFPSNFNATGASQLQQNLKYVTNVNSDKSVIYKDMQLRSGQTDETVALPSLWSVCAPSSCGIEGVKRVADFNMQFFASALGARADVTIMEDTCYYENDGSYTLDAASWSFLAFVAVIIGLIIASTLVEYLQPASRRLSRWRKYFFSPLSLNQILIKDLLRLPEVHAPGQLGCLHGIRTLSMLWAVLGHAYGIAGGFPLLNYVSYEKKFSQQWFMAPILNAYLAVDTFFLLSGLLTVYVPMMDLAKGRKFNVFKYYLYRYLRITAPLSVAIWFISTVSVYTGKGPLWFGLRSESENCQEYWWTNLLYISNYYFEVINCMGHTWYLCVDMQLALLAPLIIYPLMKWPKFGLGAICLLTLGSMAAIFGVTYTENLPWTRMSENDRYNVIIYKNTPMRASPYLIGMALGYALSKKFHVPLPKWGVALGWFTSTALALAIVFLVLIPYSDGYVQNALEAAFYGSLHKPAWALILCWIIWACVNGYGGVVNKLLSWKYFVPTSKLTFCCYLTHLLAMNVYGHGALRRTPYYVSHFENFHLLCGFVILTMPSTIILYVAIEAPVMNFLRLAFKSGRNSQDSAGSPVDKVHGKKV